MLLRRALALAGLALVAATWRLWTPQHVFPQVPLLGFATQLPPWLDWIGAGGMLSGLALALIAPLGGRWPTVGLVAFAASTAAMMVADQMRLQAWAYQFVLVALVLALADRQSAFALLRLLVVSFYFHSALSKLDYAFLHTLGQQFVATLAGAFGATIVDWSDGARWSAAAAFPLLELAVAIGLCFARTRGVALAGAVALHVVLLVILGPWGLDHKPGVLIWNGYFIVQDLLLFARARPSSASKVQAGSAQADEPRTAEEPGARPRADLAAATIVWAAVLLPLLAPTACFDMWPSWGLYAPSAERVVLHVHRRDLDPMPLELRAFVEHPSDATDPWLRVRLDRWSLDALGAPICPQNRCQIGVAEAVITRYATGHRFRLMRFELAERFTGRRRHDILDSLPQFDAARGEYFFNTRPRQRTLEPRHRPAVVAPLERGQPIGCAADLGYDDVAPFVPSPL